MTNDETYTIFTKDYEQISNLSKGSYVTTRSADGAIQNMEILEEVLNGYINEAIQVMNEAINIFNSQVKPPRRPTRNPLSKRRPGDPMVFRDEKPAARLTRNQAILNETTIAVAYKLVRRSTRQLVTYDRRGMMEDLTLDRASLDVTPVPLPEHMLITFVACRVAGMCQEWKHCGIWRYTTIESKHFSITSVKARGRRI